MRVLISVIVTMLTMGGDSLAQSSDPANLQPNPVLAHYRAYRAAVEAGNLTVAESEAAAALAASVSRDGEGGRTAVLALNLARVRLEVGRADAALAPARQAFSVASQRGEISGVDPLLARLVLGRAELGGADPASGAASLLPALNEAAARVELEADIYDAATSLGVWAFRARQYEMSREAWSIAAQRSGGAQIDHGFARAQALTAMAASIVMDNARPNRSRTASYNRAAHQPAEDALAEAIALLAPMAAIGIESGEMTIAQSEYAQARAWRTAMYSRLTRRSAPEAAETSASAGEGSGEPLDITSISAAAPRNVCPMHVVERPSISYPREALEHDGVGAVVVRLVVSDSGSIQDVRIAAAVPQSGGFREAISTRVSAWRVERRAGASTDCRMAQLLFIPIGFSMGY